ncbi:hypothetical protein WBJ53_11160 [Spirosoma sp. SC4-14]|uniref:hypothetical protein n=1 Tax=Spirosoma sp. SC4-14 TaxID=3128900 RepID=UPI0030CBD2BC
MVILDKACPSHDYSNRKKYTLNKYLTREARSLYKHEFYNGKIVGMAGGKARHNQLAATLTGALKYALRPLPRKFIVYNGVSLPLAEIYEHVSFPKR